MKRNWLWLKTLINSMNQEFQPELYKRRISGTAEGFDRAEDRRQGDCFRLAGGTEQRNRSDGALKASIEQTSTKPKRGSRSKKWKALPNGYLGKQKLKPMLIGAIRALWWSWLSLWTKIGWRTLSGLFKQGWHWAKKQKKHETASEVPRIVTASQASKKNCI